MHGAGASHEKVSETADHSASTEDKAEHRHVLPQSTNNELVLSYVHTKLDAAHTFLQHDVGYILLDDAGPRPGGGIRLRPQQEIAKPALRKGQHSAKLPMECDPLAPAPWANAVLQDLDVFVRKLLRQASVERGDQSSTSETSTKCQQQPVIHPNAGRDSLFRASDIEVPWEERQTFSSEQPVKTGVLPLSSSGCSSGSGPQDGIFMVLFSTDWKEVLDLKLQQLDLSATSRHLRVYDKAGIVVNLSMAKGHPLPSSDRFPLSIQMQKESPDYVKQEMFFIMQLSKEVFEQALYSSDLVLVHRFQHMLYEAMLEEAAKDAHAAKEPPAASQQNTAIFKHERLFKIVLQCVQLMHLCGWGFADVILVLAYATVYFKDVYLKVGKSMSPNETAHVSALLIYLAHAFLLDETCPLKVWQKRIFRKYCTLKVLDAALFRLFKMRPDYSLRITEEEETHALMALSSHL